MFYEKGSKKDTSDFPRKSKVYIFSRKIFLRFFKENLWYLFFEKKISQVLKGNLRYFFGPFT